MSKSKPSDVYGWLRDRGVVGSGVPESAHDPVMPMVELSIGWPCQEKMRPSFTVENFTVKNFKSYRQATLRLAPLTLLIGANGSGKSNLIEALRLLSWTAQGNTLGSISSAVQEQSGIRGTVQDLGFRGNDGAVSLMCHTTHDTWNSYAISLERHEGRLHLSDERLTGKSQTVPLFEVKAAHVTEGSVQVAYNNFARGGLKPQVTCNNQMPILHQFQSSVRFKNNQKGAQKNIPQLLEQYQNLLSSIVFLDPQPSAMRGYSFKSDRNLSGDGTNLSGVLYNLCSQPETEDELLKFIKTLPEQDIKDITFIETERAKAMVKLTETFGDVESLYDATQLSDGTLRVLAIAAAVLSAPLGSLVVIEEVDNGIHPSRAKQLLESLLHTAHQRNLRVLLSTHNPALLDSLPDDAVHHVVFCYRHGTDGASHLIRLEDIPNYPALIAQGTVGRLMTRGIIERFAKHSLEPEERKRQLRAWLAKLREPVA